MTKYQVKYSYTATNIKNKKIKGNGSLDYSTIAIESESREDCEQDIRTHLIEEKKLSGVNLTITKFEKRDEQI